MTSQNLYKDDRSQPEGPIRAAEYVRMSTELQKYSTENQSDAIRRYADEREIEIVRTYCHLALKCENAVVLKIFGTLI